MRPASKFAIEPAWSSSGLPWTGLQLDHIRLETPVETYDLATQQVFLHVQLANPGNIKITEENKVIHQRLDPGEICLIPKGWSGSLAISIPIEFLGVQIDADLIDAPDVILRRGIQDEQILRICQALDAEARGRGASGRLFAESLTAALALRLAANYSNRKAALRTYVTALPSKRVRRIEEFVEANLGNDMALNDLANVAELSPFHFARLFRQSTGRSPHQYLLERRMEEAKKLLAHSDLKIADIGQRLGYQSQSHFSAMFKRMVGASPGQFRLDRNISKNGHIEQVSAR